MIGDEITLPSLSDPEQGKLHVWCENADGTGNCYNGEDTIVVTDEGLTLHEAYIDDPAYLDPSIDPTPEVNPENNDYPEIVSVADIVEYYEAYESYVGSNVSDSVYGNGKQNDLSVPQAGERNDTIDSILEKTEPLGVNLESNISGRGIWGILQQIWPYLLALLFLFFIFFIILFKRRKDDDEEEEKEKR